MARAAGLRRYPCSKCHAHVDQARQAGEAPAESLEQTPHRDLTVAHFEGADACGICHQLDDMDKLRRVTGESLAFDDAHLLCGQCHSTKLRDFEWGAHGKVIGGWAGPRQKYSCAHCHDPHRPAVAPVEALPPPPEPPNRIPKGAHP